ncbi:endonuclease domain-containing protein [Sphingomonas qomolangmaensis]|uniref:Endonuclease domain-containing protein n=1 Tax=Sphingomonas qomolangmaensis TaxID=2918765 RepID=A0ABY5L654_9SPHN|nr:endonuclease domain-containing protein [Sphingomonas qomolangmaensis]UUL82430.1 endonuclease domain-containing protein [Sphingomonas qomolangmaensis]
MDLSGPPHTKTLAKRLRRTMSLPEVLLWQQLRRRPGGQRFRRQHPAGPYVLDFYCDAVKLCIEVDGEAHSRGNRPENDAARDAWLHARGVRTLRISASDVLSNLDAVMRHIEAAARGSPPPPSLRDGPPPPAGEE